MIIKQLNIYPIKGLGGITVQSAKALEKGLENDRRFMLVDAQGNFLSQRNTTEMVLFRPSIVGNQLVVQYKEESITLNLHQEEGKAIETVLWDESIQAIQVGSHANEWFSDQLGFECTLVKMNKQSSRIKILKKSPDRAEVSFADGYPYLILGTASLDKLNGKLENALRIDRFRANIIVNTTVAHEEDEVDNCSINGLKFRVIKPCARCEVISIDQQLGIKSKEPLKTLAKYRQEDNKVYFGVNAVCIDEGVIAVGDKLEKL